MLCGHPFPRSGEARRSKLKPSSLSCVFQPPMSRQNTDDGAVLTLSRKAQQCHNKLQPRYLLAKAQDHYQTYGPGKVAQNSREKVVYMKERKALKTIAIVFCGRFFSHPFHFSF